MLSAQEETLDGDTITVEHPRVKRANMLKKTMKVFGNIKPKFKKNTRSKSHEMELMESCDSIGFDLSEGSEREGGEDQVSCSDDEEVKSALKISTEKNAEVVRPPDPQEDSSGHVAPGVVTPISKSGCPGDDTPSSPKTPQSNGDILSSLDNEVTDPKSSRHLSRSSRKSREGNKEGFRSSLPGTPNSSRSREAVQALRVSDPNISSPGARSNRNEAASPTQMNASTRSIHKNLMIPSKSHTQGLPRHLPNCIPEKKGELDDDMHNDTSLKLLSMAFGDESAMGGYFAKLQEIKRKHPATAHSSSSPAAEQTIQESKPSSVNDLSRGKAEKEGRNFKPSKNIKKMLRLKRSPSTVEKSVKPAKLDASVPQSKDEAVALMLEFSTMLSAKKEHGDRPMKTHTSRPARSFVFDETDDDCSIQEFPEIPTAKRTSLGDIRRMIDSSKGEFHGSLSQNSKGQTFRTTYSHYNSRSGKALNDGLQGTASAEKPKNDLVKKSLIVKKTDKIGQSPMSVTDFPANPQVSLKDKLDKPSSPPTAPDEALLSPRSRKHRNLKMKRSSSDRNIEGSSSDRNMKRPSSDAPSTGNQRNASSIVEPSTKMVAEELEELLETKQTPSGCSGRPQRIASTPSPAKMTVNENGEEAETDPKKESTSSHGTPRRHTGRKAHERHGDQTDVDGGSVESRTDGCHAARQANNSSPKEEVSEALKDTETTKDGNSVKGRSNIIGSPRRRSRKPELNGRATPEIELNRSPGTGRKSGPPKGDCRRSSASIIGRPPLNSSGSGRLFKKQPEHSSAESQKSRNPSLAQSLEMGVLSKMVGNDGQYSVSTDGGSAMFVNGKDSYSKIRSDSSVAAPQLVIGPLDGVEHDLRVKNV